LPWNLLIVAPTMSYHVGVTKCGVVDDIQMTTTLISLDPWLLHHFIVSTKIDRLMIKCIYIGAYNKVV
jgi:hypothetical protein